MTLFRPSILRVIRMLTIRQRTLLTDVRTDFNAESCWPEFSFDSDLCLESLVHPTSTPSPLDLSIAHLSSQASPGSTSIATSAPTPPLTFELPSPTSSHLPQPFSSPSSSLLHLPATDAPPFESQLLPSTDSSVSRSSPTLVSSSKPYAKPQELPLRSPNSFMLFRKNYIALAKARGIRTQRAISGLASASWAAASVGEKEFWQQKANAEKAALEALRGQHPELCTKKRAKRGSLKRASPRLHDKSKVNPPPLLPSSQTELFNGTGLSSDPPSAQATLASAPTIDINYPPPSALFDFDPVSFGILPSTPPPSSDGPQVAIRDEWDYTTPPVDALSWMDGSLSTESWAEPLPAALDTSVTGIEPPNSAKDCDFDSFFGF
ncbi:hypothetical protein SCHPADRAFT_897421 [Schizopora paradoxa]|uniref:HMG box domain-containing protein n=1 Tax=Schizopora paradoxa TaxID=27342 RepID=A0A0H2QWL0_9AGAM|nr:hypothetical protein SCHPADRAFT_897421 [Schizopora paradoxa]